MILCGTDKCYPVLNIGAEKLDELQQERERVAQQAEELAQERTQAAVGTTLNPPLDCYGKPMHKIGNFR